MLYFLDSRIATPLQFESLHERFFEEAFMAKGISLHIGLNHVDPKHYQGWDGELNACITDAKDMRALAKKRGFAGNTLLLDGQATAEAVSAAILDASKKLSKGDIFLLTTRPWHRVRDTNGDEKDNDRMDETWVLRSSVGR
jgi:hypothetical protein